MATQQEMEATYNYMDEIFRLSLGETGDITCAMYNGDFSKTLAQAQEDKHDYVLDALNFFPGFRMLDIGSGWGPMLRAAKERGGHGVGVTLSTKHAESCRGNGLEAYVKGMEGCLRRDLRQVRRRREPGSIRTLLFDRRLPRR